MDEIFGGQSAIHDAEIMNQVQNRINAGDKREAA